MPKKNEGGIRKGPKNKLQRRIRRVEMIKKVLAKSKTEPRTIKIRKKIKSESD